MKVFQCYEQMGDEMITRTVIAINRRRMRETLKARGIIPYADKVVDVTHLFPIDVLQVLDALKVACFGETEQCIIFDLLAAYEGSSNHRLAKEFNPDATHHND